jgi:putative membrane protein
MKSLSAAFLGPEDRARISACVQEVEKSTSAEIVPLVRSASSAYPAALMRGALLVGLVLATAATVLDSLLTPWGRLDILDVWLFPGVFVVAFAVVSVLARLIPGIARIFVTRAEISEEVGEAAMTAFFRHRLAETRDRTGILLFVSVFERRVVVLADEGINAKVHGDTWQQVVDIVLQGIRDRRAPDGLCRAVARCGEIVSAQFPVRAGDTNELRNLIIED